jgi:hypothetical protein
MMDLPFIFSARLEQTEVSASSEFCEVDWGHVPITQVFLLRRPEELMDDVRIISLASHSPSKLRIVDVSSM